MTKFEPVSDYENRKVHGDALCDAEILEERMQKVGELRERQKAYQDGLPSDPQAAIAEALGTLGPNSECYHKGFEEALHLTQLVEEVLRNCDLDKGLPLQEAAAFAAMRSAEGLMHVRDSLDHVGAVLGKAHRASLERG